MKGDRNGNSNGNFRGWKYCANDGMAAAVQRIAAQYTDNIIKRLADYGYKENLVHLYVAGGGGCLLRNYSDIALKGNVTFIEDICANAKGYEYLAVQKQRRQAV